MSGDAVQVNALIRVARNVSDLDRVAEFYVKALGFEPAGAVEEDPALAELLRVRNVQILRLRSAGCEIELSRCVPSQAGYEWENANFVDFQHIALLTSDIHSAYARVLACGAEAISHDGPIRLPPASGGVTAVKFRDPEGHPLEFIEKPSAGYDHSAISVVNVNRSVSFYAGIGVVLDAKQRNQGVEQEALDGLEGSDVEVVALRPLQPSPHVELLCYSEPKAVPCQWAPSDICADRLVFGVEGGGLRLLRDPDGHVVLLDGR